MFSKKVSFILLRNIALILLLLHYSVYHFEYIHISEIYSKINSANTPSKIYDQYLLPKIIGIDANGYNITYEEDAFDGYNIFVVQQTDLTTSNNLSRYLVIMDMNGQIIRMKDVGSKGNLDIRNVEFLNSTTILLGEDEGAVLWNLYTFSFINVDCTGHHEYEYNPNSNTIFTFNEYSIDIDGIKYRFDYINEYNLTGHLVWSLDTRSFISHTQWCPFKDMIDNQAGITHSNTIFFDPEEDIFYYNPRNVNTFYKINHTSGEIIWSLGQFGDFTLFDLEGNEQESLFFHPHAIEQIDDDEFILFDNNYHNYIDPSSKVSRIVELKIDEITMTANESWVWAAPPTYYSHAFGDADRLPNGNRLATFGTTTHPDTHIGPRLVEVNNAGEIVWELNYPNSDEFKYKIHRMERFRWSPVLNSPPDIKAFPDETIKLTWQTWYNCRMKKQMKGSYFLYQDGTLIESGSHVYAKFWRPTTLTFDLGHLEIANYNYTLVITDEAGHETSDNITVLVNTSFPTSTNEKVYWTGILISSSGLLSAAALIRKQGKKREGILE